MKAHILSSGTCRLVVFCTLLVLFFSNSADAQLRSPDKIFTVRKDTLRVKITVVGLTEINYKNLTDDSSKINFIRKVDILKIIYGNGDVEEFGSTAIGSDSQRIRKYYQAMPRTKFQREIATWPDARLLAEKRRYKANTVGPMVGGFVSISLGAGLYFAGLVNSAFDNESAGTPMIVGGVVGVGGGIALTVFGGKSSKKYKAVKTEIAIRDIQDYPRAN